MYIKSDGKCSKYPLPEEGTGLSTFNFPADAQLVRKGHIANTALAVDVYYLNKKIKGTTGIYFYHLFIYI